MDFSRRLNRIKGAAVSCALLAVYFGGVLILSRVSGARPDAAPCFRPEMVLSPLWVKGVSAACIFSGTLLIYFVPGVFIAGSISGGEQAPAALFAKGFLINYIYFYAATTLYKLLFAAEITREVMVVLSAALMLAALLISMAASGADGLSRRVPDESSAARRRFNILYFLLIAFLFAFSWKNILMLQLNGDGVEQFWLAHSVRTSFLPTSYREAVTFIPQFSFAPAVYLNMFSLAFFGNAEFTLRISALTAFICIGFLVRDLIIELRGKGFHAVGAYAPVLLYMAIYYMIICYRADYLAPCDLAKSGETVQLALFLAGFYFLLKGGRGAAWTAALLLILGAGVRYNGMIIMTFFLAAYSFIFRKYRALLIYLSGLAIMALALIAVVSRGDFTFLDMARALHGNVCPLYTRPFDAGFTAAYTVSYFALTAGLSLFLLWGLRDKMIRLMALVTLVCLLMPLRSGCVPAHYFVPVFMFPLLAYYLSGAFRSKAVVSLVIIMELAALFYVFPREETRRADDFISGMDKICLATSDLFEARKRSLLVAEVLELPVDERAIMYYADLEPAGGKEYLVSFAPPRPGIAKYRTFATADGVELFLRKGAALAEFEMSKRKMIKELYSGNGPYMLQREES